MSRLKRETAKVNCQYCGEEFSTNGIRMHEKTCTSRPADEDVDDDDAEEDVEEDDSEDIEDDTEDTDSEDDGEDESEEDADSEEDKEEISDDLLKVRSLVTTSLFYYTDYINLNDKQEIALPKDLAKDLLRKGLVELV